MRTDASESEDNKNDVPSTADDNDIIERPRSYSLPNLEFNPELEDY
jgi:hypothetical protein